MKTKSFNLTENLIQEIENLQEQTNQNGSKLDASTIVRLALQRGLPILATNLQLETLENDIEPPIADV
jgi:uncharacterized iron-regulated protein